MYINSPTRIEDAMVLIGANGRTTCILPGFFYLIEGQDRPSCLTKEIIINDKHYHAWLGCLLYCVVLHGFDSKSLWLSSS